MRWSPLAGCRDDAVVPLQVDVLVEASDSGREAVDANHWGTGAKQILLGFFYAAAHHERSPGALSVVQRWLATKNLEEPLSILSKLGTEAATTSTSRSLPRPVESGDYATAGQGSNRCRADVVA